MVSGRGSADILVVGPLPPPVHGQAVATQHMLDLLERNGFSVCVEDTGEGHARGPARWTRAAKLLRAWRSLATSSAPVAYISVNANRGVIATVLLCAAARARGKALFVHHHSYRYIGAYDAAVQRLLRVCGPNAVHIVQCGRMGDDLRSRYPPSSIRTMSYSNIESVDIAQDASRAGDRLTLGHLSNLSFEKGVGIAVDSFRRVREVFPKARLILAGPIKDDFARGVVEGASREFGSSFEHRGAVYGEAKQRFFNDIDIFVFPTQYETETQGIVNLEAMAAGRPVVAFARCCIPIDIGEDGGRAVPLDGDFPEELLAFVHEFVTDPEGRSRRARSRYDHLLQENVEEADIIVRQMRSTLPHH